VLVANGKSNQEIADELVISERTARTHVSNVLRKLELTSRTQAALVAVRQGLVPPST
jgi:DNA-binding NarL/FixJ family response regulator